MLVSLKLNATGFLQYRCERPLSLGLNLSSLAKILKCAEDTDCMEIAVTRGSHDVAAFRFDSHDTKQTSHFRLKLMNVDATERGLPDEAEDRATITMPCAEYGRVMSDLGAVGDTMTIKVEERSVSFSADGEECEGEVTMHHTEDADSKHTVSISTHNPITVTCSGKCLSMFAKACPIADTVTITLADDSPISLNFVFADDRGSLRYFLAPKVEVADEEE